MSFKAMAWASRQQTGSTHGKIVLMMLADRASDEGLCWPSLNTIATDCEISLSTVKRTVKVLESKGFVKIVREKDDRGWKSNRYILDMGVGSDRPKVGSHGPKVGSHGTKGRFSENQGVGSDRPPNLSEEPVKEPEDICGASQGGEESESPHALEDTNAAEPPSPPPKVFIRPTVADVYNRMCYNLDRRKILVDQDLIKKQAEKFWNHHDANGWKRGKTKMKNWKSAVATWMGNDFDKVFEGQSNAKGGTRGFQI